MDDKKDVINNGENQANNMDYSFDFANQVDANPAPVTPEVTPTENVSTLETPAADNVAATPVSENVVPEVSATESVTPETVTNVQDAAPTVEVTPEVTPTPEVTSAAENGVTTETVEQSTTDTTNAEGIPVMPGEGLVTPETAGMPENNSEEDLELIKDKKATKRFLIILFVILLIFIIALPFIFSVAG